MAIVQATIKSEILLMLEDTAGGTLEEAKDAFADKLATAIVNALKSAQVVIPPGGVAVVGSPSAQSNPAPVLGSLQ